MKDDRDSTPSPKGLEFIPDAFFIAALDGTYLCGSIVTESMTGFPPEEMVGRNIFDFAQEHQLAEARAMVEAAGQGRQAGPALFEVRSRQGGTVRYQMTTFPVRLGGTSYVLAILHQRGRLERVEKAIRDEILGEKASLESKLEEFSSELSITTERLSREIIQRRLTEETLKASEKKFRTLVDLANEAIVIAQDGLFKFVNAKGLELFGIPGGDILEESISRFIHPDDRAMVMERHRKRLTGEEAPPLYTYRLVDASGHEKLVELRAVLTEWNGRPATLNFLTDLTERRRVEANIRESYDKLQKTMEGIIQVIASTVDIRDPYTAGHQNRVSKLAGSIAETMGLPLGCIEGIHMAGLIHDLGKISVPAEILSKPGKLTNFEFEIIKSHPEVGYNILKPIDFPWPIATIVVQHHERIDGSGYPRGLAGNDILIEAKIIGVADVVEAMASHRPYRPALGIDVALGEITKNRGILYDGDVVAACLDLFHQKRYRLD
jgi:PAS domain S-box-containing protein/putative nucleotidyltransferase with HDIG domain